MKVKKGIILATSPFLLPLSPGKGLHWPTVWSWQKFLTVRDGKHIPGQGEESFWWWQQGVTYRTLCLEDTYICVLEVWFLTSGGVEGFGGGGRACTVSRELSEWEVRPCEAQVLPANVSYIFTWLRERGRVEQPLGPGGKIEWTWYSYSESGGGAEVREQIIFPPRGSLTSKSLCEVPGDLDTSNEDSEEESFRHVSGGRRPHLS